MKKLRFLIVPILALTTFAGVVAFHPGRAWSEPQISKTIPLNVAGTYTIDPMHTSVGFEVGHMGLSSIQGRFNKVSGTIQVDPKNLDNCKVEVTIDVASVDTAVAPRDAHLRTSDFFDATKFPTITFKSTSVRKAETGYIAEGNLTIKDVTKSVSIPFQVYGPNQEKDGAWRGGIIADPFTINRLDYGVGADTKLPNGEFAIGNKITIHLSTEASQTVK